MTERSSVVFCGSARTAIGAFGGSLKDTAAPDLGAIAIRAAVSRAGLKPEEVETVAMGNVVQAGAKMNPARQAAIRAGLPVTAPAMTVNRVCGSGAQAIVSMAQEILLGGAKVAVAGGMENMDLAPHLVARARWGYRLGDGQLYDSVLRDGLNDAFSGEHSGWHTEDLVKEFSIGRETQDQWALRSQQRFGAAQADGKFKAEIVPVEILGRKGPSRFEADEHNRPGTTLDALTALKPAFRDDGTITAGNAPGVNSGAAATVLADESWAERRGLAPVARLVSYGIAAVEPGMFGLGPIPAVKQALDRAGWNLGAVERVEINEAFAAIVIAVARELGLPEDIVNVEGGASLMDIRSAPPGQCSRPASFIRCNATALGAESSLCASAAVRESRSPLRRSRDAKPPDRRHSRPGAEEIERPDAEPASKSSIANLEGDS